MVYGPSLPVVPSALAECAPLTGGRSVQGQRLGGGRYGPGRGGGGAGPGGGGGRGGPDRQSHRRYVVVIAGGRGGYLHRASLGRCLGCTLKGSLTILIFQTDTFSICADTIAYTIFLKRLFL